VDDYFTWKFLLLKIADTLSGVLTRVELRVPPSIQVGITVAQVVVEVDEIPRGTTDEFLDELCVGHRVSDLVSHVDRIELRVTFQFIIEDQDSHEITPHSFGPIV
jgi:hypothetical protein